MASLPPVLKPIRDETFDFWKAHHLLNRAGFGGTPQQVRMLADWGLDKAIDHLVDCGEIPYEAVKEDTFKTDIMAPLSTEERMRYRRAQQSQDERTVEMFRQQRMQRQREDRRQIREVQRWWLKRMIESPRPLEEKLTLFWHGHFATGYRTIENSYHMFMQNQMLRTHGTSNFADLCFQIVRDPAMLAYLDNNESHRRAPNENLARELMELFTLGEGNGYGENDIKQGARALTGYSFYHNNFIFREDFHDPGQKVIFGKRANYNGDDFVKAILGKTQTSEYICWKLYRFFVNDLPNGHTRESTAYIKSLAKVMRQEKYDLAPVLKAMFKSQHFYETSNVTAQIKSPVQLVVSAVRAYKTPVRDLNVLIEAMDLMGQNILFPPSVKGWDGGRAWINTSTLFVRHNILTHLLTGRMPTGTRPEGIRTNFDTTFLLADLEEINGRIETETAIDYLLHISFGKPPTEPRRKVLRDFAADHGDRMTNDMITGMLCLITAMPEYQLC